MMNVNSKLYKIIKKSGKPFFKLDFVITESVDQGMGKYCILQSNDLQLKVIYDKGPIHVEICSLTRDYCRSDKRHGDDTWLNLIHLANFLNDKQTRYLQPNYYWINQLDCDEEYVVYYSKIFLDNYNLIDKYMREITQSTYQEYIEYANMQNQ